MVRLLTSLTLLFWMLSETTLAQIDCNRKIVIVIDPGHGGNDLGAIGINECQEKDLVLKIAKKMVRINESLFDERYDIYLTRYTDTLVSLRQRAKLVNSVKADVFISLHCNHSDNPNAKGIEVFVPLKGKYIRESILMAHQLQLGMKQHIGYKSRGVKFANFQVLRETVDYCPTVLLELGFLSNSDEARHLNEEENVLAIALSILSGLGIKN